MNRLGAAAIVLGSAAAAVFAPVWTYALSLTLFGLPHVLVELRYVDERFAARIPRKLALGFGACLLGIVLMRACAILGLGTSGERIGAELLLGLLLIAIALPLLGRNATPLALLTGAALLLGILYAPAATLVTMALLHNLTPIGLLAERLRGTERQRAMWLAFVVFAAIPALLLNITPGMATPAGPLSVGSLDDHLGAFVPQPLLGTAFSDRLFATAAYLQCMHYAVVLHVLPRLSHGMQKPVPMLPWPAPRTFLLVVATTGAMVAIGFAGHFTGTRQVYAMFAAVHAWLEIPVLLIATASLHPAIHTQRVAA